jgi:hypothetical protein
MWSITYADFWWCVPFCCTCCKACCIFSLFKTETVQSYCISYMFVNTNTNTQTRNQLFDKTLQTPDDYFCTIKITNHTSCIEPWFVEYVPNTSHVSLTMKIELMATWLIILINH